MAKSDKKKPDDKDIVRKIWLAGIGAYGRAFTEAKGAMGSLTGKTSEAFEELVSKGEMLEAVGKYKAEELFGKGKAAVDDMRPDFDIDDRISRMRARLSGSSDGGGDRLSARVDQLEAKLDAILTHLEIGDAPAAKRGGRKSITRRKLAKRKAAPRNSAPKTAKPASKKLMTTQKTTDPKSAPKKSIPRKAASKKPPTKKS